jgi:hypothetical protein
MKNRFVIFGLMLLMVSCDYLYDYSYTVTNKTDAQISVYVETFEIDSTFIISKDSTKILFITSHGIEGAKGPYFDNVDVDLKSFTITKNDTLKSKRDYLDNASWTFSNGNYYTDVSNDEF